MRESPSPPHHMNSSTISGPVTPANTRKSAAIGRFVPIIANSIPIVLSRNLVVSDMVLVMLLC